MQIFKVVILLFSFQLMANSDFEKAEKLFQQNKLAEAQLLFEKYLKENPTHTKTLEYLGDIAGANKNWDKAIVYYQKIKNQYPQNAVYQYKYGGVLGMKAKEVNKFKALGMIGDVENAFLNAAKLDPKFIDARWALVILYIELPGIVGGSERKAQKYANELMALIQSRWLFMAKGYIDEYFDRDKKAEISYKKHTKLAIPKPLFKNYMIYI
jgi:tetratricopeptide (TPR) repeat protein